MKTLLTSERSLSWAGGSKRRNAPCATVENASGCSIRSRMSEEKVWWSARAVATSSYRSTCQLPSSWSSWTGAASRRKVHQSSSAS
ncbi:hypothetical protein AB0E67_30995 [Streptomyces sp. NPDC032161]|uniref:hypothetical protein n=1 Tax=unclassified Streptomyces TaxID=2593676 RepID=UPI0033C92A6A